MRRILHRHIVLMGIDEVDIASAKVLMSVNEANVA